MSFAKNLARCRVIAGFNQSELALELGIDKRTVSSWENERTTPSIEVIKKIADILGCSIDSLINSDSVLNEDEISIPIKSSTDARRFLMAIPLLSTFSKVNYSKLSDEEVIDFANDIVDLLKIVSKNR